MIVDECRPVVDYANHGKCDGNAEYRQEYKSKMHDCDLEACNMNGVEIIVTNNRQPLGKGGL